MDYIPVLILMGGGALVGLGALLVSHLIGPKSASQLKDSPFECGAPPVGSARQRISVRFYLVAILFLLFDVEVVFFYPWALVFREYLTINNFILIEMGIFIAIVLVGYIYVLRKGALEWE